LTGSLATCPNMASRSLIVIIRSDTCARPVRKETSELRTKSCHLIPARTAAGIVIFFLRLLRSTVISMSVYLSVRLHLKNACPTFTKFLYATRGGRGVFSTDDNAISYVFPVLCMMGHKLVIYTNDISVMIVTETEFGCAGKQRVITS